ncbi:MAG: hypothetical protein GX481_08275 [Atopobium sp.]|nr:hypothetical protein [Atopobium sp.]
MQNKCQILFHNEYDIQVIRLGKKKEYHFGNVTLTKMLEVNFGFTGVRIGGGTGNPSSSDTDVFSKLWDITCTTTVTKDDKKNAAIHTLVGEIPPDTAHVGTITELGIMVGTTVVTHALIRDAEGNPMTIEKDDLTKVIVTARITMSLVPSAPWKALPIRHTQFYMKKAMDDEGQNKNYQWGGLGTQWLELCTNSNAAIGDGEMQQTYSYIGTSYYAYFTSASCYGYGNAAKTNAAADGKRKMTFDFRAPATLLDYPVYFNTVLLGGLCYAELPNAEIVPNYTIANYPVGTGDGSTKDFLCPFSYFVKDTDSIKVADQTLTRGVDYEVISDSNHEMLQELTPFARAEASGGNRESNKSGAGLFTRPLYTWPANQAQNFGNTNGWYSNQKRSEFISMITTDAPGIFDLKSSFRLNKFRLPQAFTAATYTLSVSDDGNTFTQVFQEVKEKNEELVVDFDATGRYWKLETTVNTTAAAFSANPMDVPFLGFVQDGYIHFKTAPSSGTRITMTVQMDRPFKTSETVIDYSAEVEISV